MPFNGTRFAAVAALLLTCGAAYAQDSDQVREGAALFKDHCAKCHGADGQGGEAYANPIWGKGAQIKKFNHAGELYEYNRMLMPFDDPTQINDKQKLAIIAYILVNHEVIKASETITPARTRIIKIP